MFSCATCLNGWVSLQQGYSQAAEQHSQALSRSRGRRQTAASQHRQECWQGSRPRRARKPGPGRRRPPRRLAPRHPRQCGRWRSPLRSVNKKAVVQCHTHCGACAGEVCTEVYIAAISVATQTQGHDCLVDDRLPSACRQVIAFEFGRDVMERLRGAHPAVSAVMEIMLTDIGAFSW